MKSLHKKIGAMVLAGMVVLGGVAAGGVNSFAASSKVSKVEASNKVQEEYQIRKVKFASKLLGGKVLDYSKIKKENKSIGYKSYKSKVYKVKNLELDLYNLKNRNKLKQVRIQYKDFCYLIEFN